MNHSDCCKEKLSQNLLPRQIKPFIDQNLQMQIPEENLSVCQIIRSHSPIYTHYMDNAPSVSYLAPQVNETELYRAIRDAEQSYEAWKVMKEQLQESYKTPSN